MCCLVFQTFITVGNVTEKFHLQSGGEEEQQNEAEEQSQQSEERTEQPPAKKRKVEGHRLPVPDAIISKSKSFHLECIPAHKHICNVYLRLFAVPEGFDSWKRSRQIVHVCLERIRVNDLSRYKDIIARASLRGKISRRRKMIIKYREAVADLKEDLNKAKVTQCNVNSKVCK